MSSISNMKFKDGKPMMKNAGYDKKEKPLIALYDYLLDIHNGIALMNLMNPRKYHKEFEKFLLEFLQTDIKPLPLPLRNICLDIVSNLVDDVEKARESQKKN